MKVPFKGVIDCDLHLPSPTTAALLPYLDEVWRDQLVNRRIDRMDFQLMSFPTRSPLGSRPDWRSTAKDSASALDQVRAQALDPFGTRIAICSILHGAIALFNEDMAAAVCSAVNDYMAREWLDKEPRLRGSILVTAQSPDHAVAEIERVARDQRFVQIFMPVMGDMLPGKRLLWPIYRAAEKHGLAIGLHAGSTYRFAPTSSGWPSYQVEDYVAQSTAFENAIVSFLAEGVFNEFPTLRLVCLESGFTWLPTLLWRVNKEWRGVRQEVPWIDRAPADIVRERVRFTLQPVDAPRDGALLARTFEHMGSEDLVLFSTDYPHAQFDDDEVLPEGLSDSLLRKIMVDNPLAAYPRLAHDIAAARGARDEETVS
jgi:uncharacterized protein